MPPYVKRGDGLGRVDSISSDRGQCRTLARSMATWHMSSLKRTFGAGRTGWPDHHLWEPRWEPPRAQRAGRSWLPAATRGAAALLVPHAGHSPLERHRLLPADLIWAGDQRGRLPDRPARPGRGVQIVCLEDHEVAVQRAGHRRAGRGAQHDQAVGQGEVYRPRRRLTRCAIVHGA